MELETNILKLRRVVIRLDKIILKLLQKKEDEIDERKIESLSELRFSYSEELSNLVRQYKRNEFFKKKK